MSAATLDSIRQLLVSLKMPFAMEALHEVVRALEAGETTAFEAIETILEAEYSFRETRRIDVTLKTSRLTPIKTLESFDFSFQPSLDKKRIDALAGLDFIDRNEVIHLLGPPGTGKSHLACGLGVAAVKGGKSVYRSTLSDLAGSLALAHQRGQLANKLRQLSRASVLIVDEIGYLPLPKEGADLFFQLVSARYERGAMILTSNRSFREWDEVFGDQVIAAALLDRLLHHAIVIQIEGASYRIRAHTDLIGPSAGRQRTVAAKPRKRGRPRKEPIDENTSWQ